MTIPLYHYALLKGHLLGQNAPAEILTAVEALYMAAVQRPLASDAKEAIQRIIDEHGMPPSGKRRPLHIAVEPSYSPSPQPVGITVGGRAI